MPPYLHELTELILIQTHSCLTENILMWLNTSLSDLNQFLCEQILVCHIVSWDGRFFPLLVVARVLLDWRFE